MPNDAAAGPARAGETRLAVVIPAYRQPQFLTAAAVSALEQDGVSAGVVIVNDGCPFASTHETALRLRDAAPERISYLQQDNAGVSAARNAGIRHALERWPATDAIFALDADNRLAHRTLERLWARLRAQPPAAWAYPSLECFGRQTGVWDMPSTFSRYRELFDNQCDTGSLMGRELFDAGVFYDESVRDYEDWELFLRASRAGFTGVHGGRVGFGYRMRVGSMLSSAQRDHEQKHARIRSMHRAAYLPRALTALEHEDLPRFALIDAGGYAAAVTASLDLEPHRVSCADLLVAEDAPPISVLGSDGLWAALQRLRVLPALLLRAQEALRRHPCVGLSLERHDAAAGLALREPAHSAGAQVHGLVAPTAASLAAGWDEPGVVLSLAVGADLLAELPAPCDRPPTAPPAAGRPPRSGSAAHTDFAFELHVTRFRTTFPHGSGGVWIVAETGGEQIAQLARDLRRDDPARGLHLALSGPPALADAAALLDSVDTLSLVGDLPAAIAVPLLARTLESADVVLVLDALLGYQALAQIDEDRDGDADGPVRVAVATQLEDDEFGLPGEAILTASEDEGLIDVFLAGSQRVAGRLADLDVICDKIAVMAPGEGVAQAALRVVGRDAGRVAVR